MNLCLISQSKTLIYVKYGIEFRITPQFIIIELIIFFALSTALIIYES